MIKDIIIIELLTIIAMDHNLFTGGLWTMMAGTAAMYIGIRIMTRVPAPDERQGLGKMIGLHYTKRKGELQ